MPELPEVETTRLGIEPVLRNKRITHVQLHRPDLRWPVPEDFADHLKGLRILALRRRAKYILMDTDKESVVLCHLGMSGTLTYCEIDAYRPRPHDHCLIDTEDGMRIVFHDPRRFGALMWFPAPHEASHPLLCHLGPEPLSNDFNAEYLAAALASKTAPIKPTIMDQRVVVGVGNIYASESLFLAGIDPRTPARKASARADKLVVSIRDVLQAALASGGSTLRDYVRSHGDAGYFQHHFRVYDKAQMPCEQCSQPVQHIVQAGRATYFCKHCQTRR